MDLILSRQEFEGGNRPYPINAVLDRHVNVCISYNLATLFGIIDQIPEAKLILVELLTSADMAESML